MEVIGAAFRADARDAGFAFDPVGEIGLLLAPAPASPRAALEACLRAHETLPAFLPCPPRRRPTLSQMRPTLAPDLLCAALRAGAGRSELIVTLALPPARGDVAHWICAQATAAATLVGALPKVPRHIALTPGMTEATLMLPTLSISRAVEDIGARIGPDHVPLVSGPWPLFSHAGGRLSAPQVHEV